MPSVNEATVVLLVKTRQHEWKLRASYRYRFKLDLSGGSGSLENRVVSIKGSMKKSI